MKKILFIIIVFGILSLAAFSCEITIQTDKTEYLPGDTVIFTVTIRQDHNNCLHEGEDPLVNAEGLTITGKTKLTEIKKGEWVIKYKAIVDKKAAVLTVWRDCIKDGAKEIYRLG
jgi:hypothetical protein